VDRQPRSGSDQEVSDLDSAFAALADSTRRAVIRELLRDPRRAGELAALVEMSPPALSRHLRVLREAGLIVEDGVESDGRVSVYKVDLEAFAPVRHWLDEVEAHWHEQLASFKEYAEKSRAVPSRGSADRIPRGSEGNETRRGGIGSRGRRPEHHGARRRKS
jgi:DNA-binding transcriptional ArsR family regulator